MAGGAERGRGVGAAVFNVTSSSVIQAAIPDRLQGRLGGAGQVLGLGLIPVAALAGGWLGGHVGLWNTLAISPSPASSPAACAKAPSVEEPWVWAAWAAAWGCNR